ncbi:MAG TPA: hypothetical protein VFQ53_14805 [Kofleriaceae bacterium]|nr:hypothetical protein [Kofleriaceae bacterium]
MTSIPDWLVERAALDEVPAASRDRLEHADPRELAGRIAALRDDNARELASYPAAPALAEIEARAAQTRRKAQQRRRRQLGLLGLATTSVAALVVVVGLSRHTGTAEIPTAGSSGSDEITRVKGSARLLAFRQVGDQAEQLEQDAVVKAGDVLQLRYNAGGHSHGVIASIDGAGVVTLHFPASEDAPPEATAVAADTQTLPNAYALDDAPRFERFFFLTADAPIDVQHSLAAVRALARRADSATAALELPAGVRQWSLRLRKADRPSHPTSP